MAKICFYCGKELTNGEKCDCNARVRNTDNFKKNSSKNNKSKKNDSQSRFSRKNREKKQKAKKTNAKFTGNSYNTKSKSNFSAFLLKFMTNQPFDEAAPLHKKLGYSLMQSFLRPIAAIDSFVYAKDFNLSIIYIFIFSLVSGLVGIKVFGANIITFLESAVIAVLLLLTLNALVMLSFRFLMKIKFKFIELLSALIVPLVFISIFFLISTIGKTSIISFSMTIISGIVAFNILHFLALKKFSGVSNDQLAVNFILIYFIFFTVVGFIFNLILSPII